MVIGRMESGGVLRVGFKRLGRTVQCAAGWHRPGVPPLTMDLGAFMVLFFLSGLDIMKYH